MTCVAPAPGDGLPCHGRSYTLGFGMLSDTGNHSPDQLTRVAASRSRDAAAGCCWDVESWASSDGEILVVRVSGELDMLTRPIVAATLAEAVSRAPGTSWSTSPP